MFLFCRTNERDVEGGEREGDKVRFDRGQGPTTIVPCRFVDQFDRSSIEIWSVGKCFAAFGNESGKTHHKHYENTNQQIKTPMKTFVLIHEWKYGTSTYVFQSEETLEALITHGHEVCRSLDIDFDEDTESITIDEISTDSPKVIRL